MKVTLVGCAARSLPGGARFSCIVFAWSTLCAGACNVFAQDDSPDNDALTPPSAHSTKMLAAASGTSVPTSGILFVQFVGASKDTKVLVITKDHVHAPAIFPARIELPIGQPVDVSATRPGFTTFWRTIVLSDKRPSQEVTIELQEDRPPFLFGYPPSDLPSKDETGFRALPKPQRGRPSSRFLEYAWVNTWRGAHYSGLLVDDDGGVWRAWWEERARAQRAPAYELQGRVAAGTLRRMKALRKTVPEGPMAKVEGGCRDCGYGKIFLHPDRRRVPVVTLAIDGETRKRIASEAADTLARWMLALRRDASAGQADRAQNMR